MKKTFLARTLALLAASISMTACGVETHFVGEVAGDLYLKGEQTITLMTSDSYPDIKFEKDIAIADVTVGETLNGKTVTKVEYVNEDTVNVTFTGTANTTPGDSYAYAMVNVGDHGLTGTSTAEFPVTFYNYAPRMSASNILFVHATDGLCKASATYSLPYGEFLNENCNADNIHTDTNKGTIHEVSVTDNQLRVSIEDYPIAEDQAYPSIVIPANCTTFNHEVTITIGESLAKADLVD